MPSYRLEHAAGRTGKPVDPIWSRAQSADVIGEMPFGFVTRSGSAHPPLEVRTPLQRRTLPQ